MNDTYVMMDELHTAVKRIQDREFERWLDENVPYWRENIEAWQRAVRASYMTMDEAVEAVVKFGQLPSMDELIGVE